MPRKLRIKNPAINKKIARINPTILYNIIKSSNRLW
jgi:hypothetical protein